MFPLYYSDLRLFRQGVYLVSVSFSCMGNLSGTRFRRNKPRSAWGFHQSHFVGVKLLGGTIIVAGSPKRPHSSSFWHFTAWKGNIQGFFHLHSVLRLWALEMPLLVWALLSVLCCIAGLSCLVLFFILLSWRRDRSRSHLPVYLRSTLIQSVLDITICLSFEPFFPPCDSGSSYCSF